MLCVGNRHRSQLTIDNAQLTITDWKYRVFEVPAMPKFAVILPAAGQSLRFKDKDKKPFVNLDGRAVWLAPVEFFVNRKEVVQCLIRPASVAHCGACLF